MKEAVIASICRTPVGRAYKGALRAVRPGDLAAAAIKEALARAPGLDPKEVEDVILGCAMPEAEQGMNVARIASLRAGIPVTACAGPLTPPRAATAPDAYLSMGLTAKNLARKYETPREEQDGFAFASHMKALKA